MKILSENTAKKYSIEKKPLRYNKSSFCDNQNKTWLTGLNN